MAGGNGSAELDTVGVDWHDEQLQRVRAVFDSVDTAAADADLRDKVLAQLPDGPEDLVASIGVFRDLLRVEHRADRFRRLLRIWTGKVAGAVRAREYEKAGMWMRALASAPVFAEEFSHLVAEARRDLSGDELFSDLVTGLVETDSPVSAAPVLAAWGEPLVEYLIGQIVVEESIVNRRHIVEFLGMAGRGDARHLTARLADSRWFVVRNVATAIGKAGRVSALPALESIADHEDDRVRVEVIRAIAALKGDGAVPGVLRFLSDSSPRVRQAAASLLRASAADSVVPGIVEALEAGTGSADDARRLVDIIAERRGPQVREALERLSSRKFALGASKAVRDAARAELERWPE
ncbi:MAG: HEAT repeat domain-containing protein [Acidimicrobiia bacterium]